ncbi:MAG: malonyl-ACP O-methyltransferase BioC [Desulforhopalus sp.]
MNIKNSQHLDKLLIADSFKASAATYEDNATVQKEIGQRIINFLEGYESINYSRVLEIGCCTGILTRQLVTRREVETIYLNDIVEEFCVKTGERIVKNVKRVEHLPGDIEQCILPGNLGLVLSSATFQWISDLPALLKTIYSALQDGGFLVFSIFGPGTMKEISALTGRGLHYHSREHLTEMLQEYFRITSLLKEERTIYFPSVREVLHHIRRTGVGGLGRSRWLPGKFKEFEKQYTARFATDKGFPVTYASTFVVAKKK